MPDATRQPRQTQWSGSHRVDFAIPETDPYERCVVAKGVIGRPGKLTIALRG